MHLGAAMNLRRRKQIAFHDFPTGFTSARIFPDNCWVQMCELMPWDLIDEKYAKNFEGSENGNVAVSSRVAFWSPCDQAGAEPVG